MTLTTCVCLQCRMECCDVPAETLYDVLHDIEYRKKWDSNVIETFDIARLTVNADVGYYSCEQTQSKTPTPQSPSRPPPLTSPLCGHSCGQAAQRPACRDGELSSPWACSLTYTLKKVPPTNMQTQLHIQLIATCHVPHFYAYAITVLSFFKIYSSIQTRQNNKVRAL